MRIAPCGFCRVPVHVRRATCGQPLLVDNPDEADALRATLISDGRERRASAVGGAMQIHLKPALRRLWRDPGTVQIGLSMRRGTVVGGLTADDARLLEELRDGVDPAEWQGRGRELIDLLTLAGVVVPRGEGRGVPSRDGDAPGRWVPDAAIWSVVHGGGSDGWDVLAGRRAAHVMVRGAGRLGTTLAATLAAAGVGHVTVEDERHVMAADLAPAGAQRRDLGRLRSEVAAEVVVRSGAKAGPPETGPLPVRAPDT